MGFREFDMGISAQQLQRRREIEQESRERELHSRIDELLTFLRPRGDVLPHNNNRYELWKKIY
jgi:hypothetical protein